MRKGANNMYVRVAYRSTRGGYNPPLKEMLVTIRHGNHYRNEEEKEAFLEFVRALNRLTDAVKSP
jgi:hypothetical protein